MSARETTAIVTARHTSIHGQSVRRIYATPFGVDVILTNGDAVSIEKGTLARIGFVAEDYRRQARRRDAGLRPGLPAVPSPPLDAGGGLLEQAVEAARVGDVAGAQALADAHEAGLPTSVRLARTAVRYGDWAQALLILGWAVAFILVLAYVVFPWLFYVALGR